MKLWLDDERPTPEGWVGAKTATEAIRLLRSRAVMTVSFDHDLGPPEAGTGYDVACAIEAMAAAGSLGPLEWAVHSANPIGRQRIVQAMRSADRFWAAAGS